MIYLIPMAVLAVLIGIYLVFWVKRLMVFWGADLQKRTVRILRVVITCLVAAVSISFIFFPGLVAIHIVIASAVFECIGFFLKKIPSIKDRRSVAKTVDMVCRSGLAGVLVAGCLMAYGYGNMNHINNTRYEFVTKKEIGREGCRIMLITDVHYGSVQKKDVLRRKLAEISAKKPDIVVLGGDIVEEGTDLEELNEVFGMLGAIESRYGVYYVYGNHDRQPYTTRKTYTDEQLEKAITDNGIEILRDRYVTVGDDIILAGREDASVQRKSVEAVLSEADKNKFIIVADHQPMEADEARAEGADLQLSGHTHAGQIWPTGLLLEWMGQYNYGDYQKEGFHLVVSSGFAGWQYPVRTGRHCEYVVIDMKGK